MVGSIAVPTDTVEEAMGVAAEYLGDRLFAIPDGEVGPRQMWAPGVGAAVFLNHPDIVLVGEESGFTPVQTPLGPLGACRIRPGVTEVSLEGCLPYATAAIAGYENLLAQRERGEISAAVRFQVSVPTAFDMVMPWFGDPTEWPAMYRSYQREMRAEFARILEVIPADELAIQWDFATEVNEIQAAVSGRNELVAKLGLTWLPSRNAEEAFTAHTDPEYIERMSDGIPDEVAFGYHLCLGTAISFPTTPADDLAWIVRLANTLVERTPHRIDFFHLPAMPDAGRDFFAPLTDLNIGDTRVFIGLAHGDGIDGIVKRGRHAQAFLPDFGISNYCGYGRQESEHIRELLSDLRNAADLLAVKP